MSLCVAIHAFQTIAKFYDEHIKRKNYDYGDLPPHIIAQILSQLRIKEFRNASIACKSWYYASFEPRVIKNIRVNFYYDSTNCDYLVRPILNARLNSIYWNKVHYRKILNNVGSTITDLEIFSKISPTQLFEIFIYLPNVRSLKITDRARCVSPVNYYRSKKITKYKEVIIRNLSQIMKMGIWTGVRDLKLYRLFLSHCPNVVELYWGDNENSTKDSGDFLFNCLLNPIENSALYKMIGLKLDNIDRKQNSKFFEKMINLALPNIKRLSLNEISSTYYDTMFQEFCKTYNFLDSLTLTGCNDQQLIDICKYMRNLKSISLKNCTANNLSQILNLNNLERLQIDRIDDVNGQDDLFVLLSCEHEKLKKLELNEIDFKTLKLICENFKNLEDLSISNLDTKDCEPIFRNLIKLEKLSITFSEPPIINSSRMRSSDRYNITNLTELEVIYISCFVPGITPDLVQKLPKLRKCWEYIWDPPDEDLTSNWVDYSLNNSEEKTVIYDISDFNWCQELIL